MWDVITDEYIKTVLRDRQGLLTAIHDRLLELYHEMDNSDEAIKSATFGSVHENIGGGRSSDQKDLTDIMLRHFQLLKAQSIEIRHEMNRLVEEQETINRIWCCYTALNINEKEILTELYVKDLPYKEVECDAKKRGVSSTTLERRRKTGLQELRKLYNSDMTNVDIISNTQRKAKEAKKKSRTVSKSGYRQISLDMLLKPEGGSSSDLDMDMLKNQRK